DVEILWPGALIQGKTHKDPVGSLRGLVIEERDSINVSIPGLPTGDNFRRVKPNQATVGSAIGEMIGNATAEGLSTPSTISFSMESYYSEKQMALTMGLSGKYLGYSGSASGSINRNQSENTITVQFYQKMFEVVVEPPQTPARFFSEDFTQAKLQEQIGLGRMGGDNLPVYVSNIVYGRMMMFSVTSTASETDIRAMLNVAYNNIGTNVTANMSVKQKTILEKSKISITSLGGDAEATIAMIQSGNWRDYFTNSAPLSSAAPLSYTFRNLGDGSIAKIVESDEFSISECTEKVGVPGVYDFVAPATVGMGDISFPVETFTGDFNGDGSEDLLLNHKGGGINQIKIGYGMADGTFAFQPVVEHTERPVEGWSAYKTYIGDIDGDQMDDIIWNTLDGTAFGPNNRNYFTLSEGGNSWAFSEQTIFTGDQWSRYNLLMGDVDNDGADELVWNLLDDNYGNIVVVANLSQNNQGLDISPATSLGARTGLGDFWGEYAVHIGDINGGGEDLIFNELKKRNYTITGLSNNDDTFSVSPQTWDDSEGWYDIRGYLGNADNNTLKDIIYSRAGLPRTGFSSPNTNWVMANLSNGDGTFTTTRWQSHPVQQDWTYYQTYVGDVDGDGIDDLSWTNQEVGVITSTIYTALGTSSGVYDFSPVKQESPYQNTWAQYTIHMLDINGDRKKDLLWIKPGSNTEIYTALAK
ncbi:MAG: thiol-activated cytolysin family protein, partial [Bacteroidota bacterium]